MAPRARDATRPGISEVERLLEAGDRRAARALAHRLQECESDSSLGRAAVGLVAAADGYDDLAAASFEGLPPSPRWLAAHLTVLMRRGPEQAALAAWERALDAFDVLTLPRRIELVDQAFDCGCLGLAGAMLRRLNGASSHPAGQASTDIDRRLAWLAAQGTERLLDPEAARHLPLKSWRSCTVWLRLDPDFDEAPARPAGNQGGFMYTLRTWLSSGPARCAMVGAGRVPDSARRALALMLDIELDRFNVVRWSGVLAALDSVLVAGLRLHDPAAATKEFVAAIARHSPVGAADMTTALLLRELGVDAVLTGPILAAPAEVPARRRLWADAGQPKPGPGLLAELAGAAAGHQAEDLLGAWREWTRSNPLAVPQGHEDVAGTKSPEHEVAAIRASAWAPSPGAQAAIEIAMAVDEAMLDPMCVAIESAISATASPLRFHLLSRGLSTEHWAAVARLFEGRADLRFHACDSMSYGLAPRLLAHTTLSTLDRLILPLLLPDHPRVLYLDTDLVVLGDLAPLWASPLDGVPLAAKPSTSPGTRWGLQMLYQALGALPWQRADAWRHHLHRTGSMLFPAFNAGVLLMNLDEMRRQSAASLTLGLVERAGMNDQDALNAYARGRYVPLDRRWNAMPRQDPTDGAWIIHFAGPAKPWSDEYVGRREDYQRIWRVVQERRIALGTSPAT